MTADPAIQTMMVEANGLAFEVDTCGSGDRLALCLHGFPEAACSWRYQLPLLAELGYRVWAPNQRGYGRSTRPPKIDDYRTAALVADVAALIDVSGARSVTLIGHDWGAAIAWLFATDRVRPLERLVIMNVPHPAIFAQRLRTVEQALRSWYILFFQLPWLPEFILRRNAAEPIARAFRASAADPTRFGPDVLDVYRRNALAPGALTALLNWYRALARDARRHAARAYPPIDIPTLLIWGEADVALSKATTLGTERYVHDLTLRYLPGVSHWVQQDAPETVNAMVSAFLRGLDVPEASEIFAPARGTTAQ
jgi:pimeloyl-ACP methyl ester carboxylesterase